MFFSYYNRSLFHSKVYKEHHGAVNVIMMQLTEHFASKSCVIFLAHTARMMQ